MRLFPDGAQSVIPAALSNSATSATVASSSSFGAVGTGQTIDAIIVDSGNPSFNPALPLTTPFEYVIITAIAGNVLTLTRGQYGSSGSPFYAGSTISATTTGQALGNLLVYTSTVGLSGLSTYTFSSIDQGGSTLEVDISGDVSAENDVWIRFDGDSAAHYDYGQIVWYSGALSDSASTAATQIVGPRLPASPSGAAARIVIPGYAGTLVGKGVIVTAAGYTSASTVWGGTRFGFYDSANAITSLTLLLSSGTFGSAAVATLRILP